MQVYPREDHFGLSILFAVLCGIGVVIILATRFLVRRAFEPYADVIAAQGFWGASRSTVRTVSQTN